MTFYTRSVSQNFQKSIRLLMVAGLLALVIGLLSTPLLATVAPTLAKWLPTPAITWAAGLPPVQIFYLPLPEDQIRTSLLQISSSTGSTMHGVTGISITADGTLLYYDQWENGYEPDLATPSNLYSAGNLGGTQIWGDGDSSNGAPPGVASDILNAGTVIVLENDVSIPRNPSTIRFDGRDKIGSTKVVAITKSAWATSPGTVLADAVEVVDTTRWGTAYKIPLGQDLSSSFMFEYTSLLVMASADGTVVQIDKDGNGSVDITQTLNQGQSYQVNGGVNSSAAVTASAPVQVNVISGDIGSSYESRWFTIPPTSQWDASYYTAVGTTSATYPANVWIYNPNASAITVNYETKAGTGTFAVSAAGAYRFVMPSLSGAHFYTTDGSDFFAYGTMDSSSSGSDQTYDWGYTLVPESSLTSAFAVGWAPGTADLSGNGGPIWVTAVEPTTIYVDYDGNGNTGSLTDINGRKYDVSYALTALESKQIYDPDKDQTGMRVYTVNGILITGAYGEDPASAKAGTPYLDVGYSIPPLPQVVLDKFGALYIDNNSNTLLDAGETVAYTITAKNLGVVTFFNTILSDTLPSNVSYITGTTEFNGNPVPDDSAPDSIFPLDEDGLNVGNLPVGGSIKVTYLVRANAFPPLYSTIDNKVSLSVGGENFSKDNSLPVNSPDVTQCTVDFVDSGGTPVAAYTEDATLYVAVDDNDQNVITDTVESLVANLVNQNTGDRETVTLTETGADTGIFRGSIPSATLAGQVADDGTLYARVGDPMVANYTDAIFGDTCDDTIYIPPPTETKVLYLSDPSQALDRVDPVATGDNSTASTTVLGSGGGTASITVVGAAASSNTGRTVSTHSFSYDSGLSGSNRILMVGVSYRNKDRETVSSVTYGGQAMTQVGTAKSDTDSSPDGQIYIFRLLNPPTGINTLLVTWNSALDEGGVVGAITYAGVDQTTPLGTFASADGNSTAPAVTVTSASNQLVFGVVAGRTTSDYTVTGGGTALWSARPFSGETAGASQSKTGAASVALGWSGSSEKWAAGGVSIKPATATGVATVAFTQTLVMADDLILPVGSAITVTSYISAAAGTPVTGMAVTTTLKANGATFATLNNPTVTSLGGTIYKVVWVDTLNSATTIAAGQAVNLLVTTSVSGLTFKILYDSNTYPSRIELPTTTVIEIDAFDLYDAAYPDGATLTGGTNGDIVYIRATISDPFGASDITTNTLQITDPNGSASTVTLTNGEIVDSSALTKTIEYAWSTPATTGNYTVTLTSYEGYEGITAGASTIFNLGFQDTGTPSRAEFTTGDNGSTTTSYSANETVCVRITDVDQNLNPATVETVTAIITASSSDQETVTLTETGIDTGVFSACITASSTTAGTTNDSTLYAPQGSTLGVHYTDPTDPSDTSSANATVQSAAPAMSLSKQLVQPGDGIARVGDTVRYALIIGNPGPTILTTATVTDTFPASCLSYQSASIAPSTVVTPTITWSNVGPIASGGSKTINLYFRADAACDPASNLADAAGVDQNSVPITTTPSSAQVITTEPGLSVSKTLSTPLSGLAEIGDTVVFTISLANTGSTSIPNLPLTDNYSAACLAYLSASPTEADASGGGVALWDNLGPLAAGNSLTMTVSFTVVGACSPTENSIDVSAATDIYSDTVPTVQASAAITTVMASIGDRVWEDTDGNGVQDSGEIGLPGVLISLTLPGGAVITTTTDVSGTYHFNSLHSGNYTVTVDSSTLSAYYVPTTGNQPLPVPLTAGQVYSSADFGYQEQGRVTGHLYLDTNGDGAQGKGDPDLADVDLIITDSNGVTQTVTTDTSGNYTATVPPGSTSVDVDESDSEYPTGYTQSEGDDPTTIAAVAGNDTDAGNDGYYLSGRIIGHVYEDLNGNGSFDAGEPGLPGVEIELSNGLTTTTDAGGVYTFTVPPGTYTLTETNPSGYTSTGDTAGGNDDVVGNVTVTGGGSSSSNDFFDAQPVTLGGGVYDDVNGNGVQESGEPGISGVLLTLSNGVTTTTDASGVYTFTLIPGTYTISETNPSGYTSTGAEAGTVGSTVMGNDSISVSLTSGQSSVANDYLDAKPGTISGAVYDDLNGDGDFDAGEPGKAGVEIILSNGLTTTTNASGLYTFTVLPGTYTLTETNASGYTSTGDVAGANDERIPGVVLTSGGSVTGQDFFDAQPVTVSGTVYDDTNGDGNFDAGELGISGVEIGLSNGLTTTTDASGNYTFTNVLPGSYALTESNPSGYTSTGDVEGANDDSIAITVTSGTAVTGQDFFDVQFAGISGHVYDDLNGDGTFDAGEPGKAGVVISLSNGLTTTTDASGVYTFTNLTPGSYTLTETNPSGYTSTGDTEGANNDTITVTLGAGGSTGNDFFDAQPVPVSGTVYDDTNGDGNFNTGEPGLAGVEIGLSNGLTTTTDANGVYTFTNVMPGSYALTESNPSGYTSTGDVEGANDDSIAITVTSGTAVTGQDFFDVQLAGISGHVYEDLNGDGSFDAGEPGKAGVVITLSNGLTTTTNASGVYTFTVPVGTYTLTETNPSGYTSTGDTDGANNDTITVTLGAGGSTGNDFFDAQPVTVSGTVYDDSNGDGNFDAGELGISGVEIGLSNGLTTTTDASGNYTFTNVLPGSYALTESNPSGYTSTGDVEGANDDSIAITVTSGTAMTGQDFFDVQFASISGHVYEDLNGDGSFDAGEPEISGVEIGLSNGLTTTTDASGVYTFTNLTAGSYTLTESNPSGYTSTGDVAGANDDRIPGVVLTSGGSVTDQDFFDAQPVTVSGTVYDDTNGDGNFDAGELGISGVEIGLSNGLTTTTDANGVYTFTNVLPGSYALTESNLSGYTSTGDVEGANDDTINLTVTSGTAVTGQDFFDTQPVTVSGTVYDDTNGDGNFDAGELGISGVEIGLSNGLTTTTDASGNYTFTNVLPGSYTLAESNPSGYTSTGDVEGANDDAINLTVTSGTAVTGQDFFDVQFAGISGHVYEDLNGNGTFDAGEPGKAGVVISLSNGLTTTTNASGVYTFTNLTPGSYTLTETNPSGYTSTGDVAGANDDTITVTLGAGGSTGNDFFDAQPVPVRGTVYDDTNGDGNFDAGELGISGVEIGLSNGLTTTTDASGNYTFTNVLPGTYALTESNPSGYSSTGDVEGGNDDTINLTFTSGTAVTGQDFFDVQLASISGHVYEDLNGNGSFDAGEPGRVGVVISLSNGLTTTTNASGLYTFTNLTPGSYTLTETNPSGYTSTGDTEGANDDTITVTLDAGGSTGNDFFDAQPVTITGAVYDDTNGDGNFDAGELGISGVEIGLSNGLTTTTDASGNYTFTNVLPGSYTLTESNPSGYSSTGDVEGTNDDTINLTVTSGTAVTGQDFFDVQLAGISGHVYEDLNGNGSFDAGEPGKAGVVITLSNGLTTTTNASGLYTFTVPLGTYTLTETNPSGYISTGDTAGANDDVIGNVTVTSGGSSGNNFFDAQLVTIGGAVYEDLNGNGLQDSGEVGLMGVIITLSSGHTATTDARGVYTFTVLPGTYTLTESNPSGYTSTAAEPGKTGSTVMSADTITVTLRSGQNSLENDFLDVQPGKIIGTIYEDTNGNGTQDPGEAGLPSVTVIVTDTNGVPQTLTTDGNGHYTATVPVGSAIIEVDVNTLPSGVTQTEGSNPTTVNLTSGQTVSAVDGYQPAAPLYPMGNRVWHDRNNNGLLDDGEPGIASATLQLFQENDDPTTATPLATVVTDANGYYTFTNVIGGRYFIYIPTPPRRYSWSSTLTDALDDGMDNDDNGIQGTVNGQPSGAVMSPVIELIGANLTIDFGFFAPAWLGDLVWFDHDRDGVQDQDETGLPGTANERGVPGVLVTLYSGLTSNRIIGMENDIVATTTTDTHGRYHFNNLLPGEYVVAFEVPTGYSVTLAKQGSSDAFDSDINPTTLRTEVISLTSGERKPTLDIGLYLSTEPVSIGNSVWYDTNQNGIQDSGETGVPGVTVQLHRADDSLVATTTTDVNGTYEFNSLVPGDYYLSFTPAAGYIIGPQDAGTDDSRDSDVNATTGRTIVTTLVAGEDDGTWDLALYLADEPASIGDFVWFDTNIDGLQSAEETGVPGVAVTLYRADGTAVATTRTDADGHYGYTNLASGDYFIEFNPMAGYVGTTSDQGFDDATDSDVGLITGRTPVTTLDAGEHDTTWDYGVFLVDVQNNSFLEPAAIGNRVWIDNGANGIQETGEANAPGVTVKLYTDSGELVATDTTDINGNYSFANLVPGDYYVEFILPAGYHYSPRGVLPGDDTDSNADPDTGRTPVVTLTDGANDISWDAGIYQIATNLGNENEPTVEQNYHILLPLIHR